MDRIENLAKKLRRLVTLDKRLRVFGADSHQYRMNPCLTERDVVDLENTYRVQLPGDYRNFLTHIANGGAGPYYGLLSLKQSLSEERKQRTPEFLSAPFPLTEAFNPFNAELEDEAQYDDKFITGSLCLSHQGCGYYDRLVVTGPQRGLVWTDGRVSDQGLVPLQIDFCTWYDDWLNESLDSIR